MNDPFDERELERVVRAGMANGLNRFANIVFADSQPLVPRAVAGGDLAASGQAPSTSEDHAATPDDLESTVTYGTAYAAAQHEGIALQERASGLVLWVVRRYTTPGTGSLFLWRPLMQHANSMERVVGEDVDAALARHYG